MEDYSNRFAPSLMPTTKLSLLKVKFDLGSLCSCRGHFSMNYRDYSALPPPCLHSSEDYFLMQREFTQQYHQLLAEQEIGFRERLHQLLLQPSSSLKQILQPKFSQRSRRTLQPKFNKKLQQDGSRSPISELSERRGWCPLCHVDCNTEDVLEKHFLGKKHQSALKRSKECSGEGKEENSKPEEPKTEQQQEDMSKVSVKENAELNEKQMME